MGQPVIVTRREGRNLERSASFLAIQPSQGFPTPLVWLDAISGTWCPSHILCRWDS